MTRIAFCLTCFERIDPHSEGAFLALAIAFGRMSPDVEVTPFVRHGMACADACNQLMEDVAECETASGQQFDRVFWMDDDVCLYTEDLGKLLDSVDAKHPAVFSLCFYRTRPYLPSMWRYEMTPKLEGITPHTKSKRILNWPADTLVPVHGAGLCAAVFDRKVFDAIPKPYFAWIEGGYKRQACTPDGFLCARLNRVGIPIYCHTGVRTRHVGFPEMVDEPLAVQYKEEWAASA